MLLRVSSTIEASGVGGVCGFIIVGVVQHLFAFFNHMTNVFEVNVRFLNLTPPTL